MGETVTPDLIAIGCPHLSEREMKELAGGKGVIDRLPGEAAGLVPGAGAAVEVGDSLLSGGPGQLVSKQIGEQVLVPVPLPRFVQGDQEQVGPLQRRQEGVAVAATGDSIAQ